MLSVRRTQAKRPAKRRGRLLYLDRVPHRRTKQHADGYVRAPQTRTDQPDWPANRSAASYHQSRDNGAGIKDGPFCGFKQRTSRHHPENIYCRLSLRTSLRSNNGPAIVSTLDQLTSTADQLQLPNQLQPPLRPSLHCSLSIQLRTQLRFLLRLQLRRFQPTSTPHQRRRPLQPHLRSSTTATTNHRSFCNRTSQLPQSIPTDNSRVHRRRFATYICHDRRFPPIIADVLRSQPKPLSKPRNHYHKQYLYYNFCKLFSVNKRLAPT
jgi:hypothetical protein